MFLVAAKCMHLPPCCNEQNVRNIVALLFNIKVMLCTAVQSCLYLCPCIAETGLHVPSAHMLLPCVHAVDPGLLANDTYSQQMLSAYNSLNVRVNITIDNQAWYPDLGSVGRANHNRLANKLQSEGFNVVSRQLARCLYRPFTPVCTAWIPFLAIQLSHIWLQV